MHDFCVYASFMHLVPAHFAHQECRIVRGAFLIYTSILFTSTFIAAQCPHNLVLTHMKPFLVAAVTAVNL